MVEFSKPSMVPIGDDIGIERGKFGNGECEVYLTVEQKHCNKGGVCHGGLHTMLLDMALGGALVSTLKIEEWCATTQLNVSFISSAQRGDVISASGRVVKRGRNVAHLSGEIHNQNGRLIASASGTWAIWDHKPASMG